MDWDKDVDKKGLQELFKKYFGLKPTPGGEKQLPSIEELRRRAMEEHIEFMRAQHDGLTVPMEVLLEFRDKKQREEKK